jgi:tyrosyl-tRNA synthetase
MDDGGVEDYLKVFTELSKEDIDKVMAEQNQNPAARHAQTVLADEVTKFVHGEAELEKAKKATAALVSGGTDNDSLAKYKTTLPITTIDLLVNSGLCTSNSDARRLVEGNGVYINDIKFNKAIIEAEDFKDGKLILRRGKAINNSVVIELEA